MLVVILPCPPRGTSISLHNASAPLSASQRESQVSQVYLGLLHVGREQAGAQVDARVLLPQPGVGLAPLGGGQHVGGRGADETPFELGAEERAEVNSLFRMVPCNQGNASGTNPSDNFPVQ